MDTNDYISNALLNTEVIRFPRQKLATFGVTNIKYYIITEPLINQLVENKDEGLVIREGKVIAQRPQIITPHYLRNTFSDFEHGEEYSNYLKEQGEEKPGLLYKYKNEFEKMEVISSSMEELLEKLEKKIDEKGDPLTAIIKGVNTYWDISLMKFIFELTTSSLVNNIVDLDRRGLLSMESGIPRDGRRRIEKLFEEVKKGNAKPQVLKKELDSWGVFKEYENRFLDLFVRK